MESSFRKAFFKENIRNIFREKTWGLGWKVRQVALYITAVCDFIEAHS